MGSGLVLVMEPRRENMIKVLECCLLQCQAVHCIRLMHEVSLKSALLRVHAQGSNWADE